MSDLEEVQLSVSSDAGRSASLKRGHNRTGSTGSAKSASHFHLLSTFTNCMPCLCHMSEQIMIML